MSAAENHRTEHHGQAAPPTDKRAAQNREQSMDSTAIIQRHLAEIEETAAQHSANVLKAQDAIIAAHALVDLLKAHGAPEDLSVSLCQFHETATPLIYPHRHGGDAATLAAIDRAGLKIVGAEMGYYEATTRLSIEGHETVELYVSSSACPWQQSA